MSAAEFQPLQGSVAFKVIEYLTDNAGSRLNQSTISEKFEVQYNMVHTLLGPAVKAGVLTRGEDPDSTELAYMLAKRKGGAKVVLLDEASATATIARPKASALPSARLPALNLNAIQINSGVPLPGARQRREWEPLFDRMEVGDSFAVALVYRTSVSKAATHFRKAEKGRLTVRQISDSEVRVWRLA